MGNHVVIRGRKIWIEDKNGRRVSKKYKYYDKDGIKITKCLLGIILKKIGGIYQIIILNINSLKVVYDRKFVDYFMTREVLVRIRDYTFCSHNRREIYDYNGNAFTEKGYMEHFFSDNLFVILDENTKKYKLLFEGKVAFTSRIIHVSPELKKIFTLIGNKIKVFNIYKDEMYTLEFVDEFELSSQNIDIEVIGEYNQIIIEYFDEKLSNRIKTEIRDVESFEFITELSSNFSKKYSLTNDILQFMFYEKNAKKWSGYKLYDLVNRKYISDDLYVADKKLGQYLILTNSDNYISICDKNKNIILNGKYTDITFSRNKDYFILDNVDLKGIATLSGEVILEPKAVEIYETSNEFYYVDITSDDSKKKILKK